MPNYLQSQYVYSKKRRDFGRQPLFQNVPAHMIDSINPNRQDQKQYILRNPVHREVQATLPQSQNDANTKQVVFHEQGINHEEGGWPREVQPHNEEHVHRHLRRVLHDDSYIHAVLDLSPTITHYIDQNNAINMYQTYFGDIPPQEPVEKYNARVTNTFRDTLGRPASCVVWTVENNPKIAVAYCHKDYPPVNQFNASTLCYLWDVTRQSAPTDEIEPLYPCWQLACSPAEPELLVAGLEDGTVNLFDIRSGKDAVTVSSPYNSHRSPVTALLYQHTRSNCEFFTGSSDGQCLWWDTRHLTKPIAQLPMSVKLSPNEAPNAGNSEGVSSLEYDPALPTKFLCGTESGLVINANRLGREHSEILSMYWEAHTGPVRAVHRSPCTLRMFLTCGDFSVRVWSEEVRTAPIIVTQPYRHQVLDAAWAPHRYSSYMVVTGGGYFYYWDLLRKYREPVLTLKISDHQLTKVQPHKEGTFIAAGDDIGSVYLLQITDSMAEPEESNKHLMHQTYDRETKREHIIDNRIKEIRLKAREVEIPHQEPPDEDEICRVAEERYWDIVKEEQYKMEDIRAISA